MKALFPHKCLACKSLFNPDSINNLSKINTYPSSILAQGININEKEEDLNRYINNNISFENMTKSYLCPSCIAEFIPLQSPLCPKCGIMYDSREGIDHLCHECLNSSRSFGEARSFGVYDLSLMKLIHALKYHGKTQLDKSLGYFLFSTFVLSWDTERVDIILPVPLHKKRLRQRGFNQSFLLVKKWKDFASNLNMDLSSILIKEDILIRKNWQRPQTGLKRKERKENIKDAFRVSDVSAIRGKRILLVDDVFTTGATVEECSKVLIKNGAKGVDVLTLARTM